MFASNTSQVSSDATYIEDVFSTYLYTGNGSTQTITNGIDVTGKGALVWIKNRSDVKNNILVDTARGANNWIASNLTNAQASDATKVSSFSSTGFTVGSDSTVNLSTQLYASWTFRKQPKFFDVVTYTGTGSARTVSHNLGSVPGCIIIKRYSDSGWAWRVYHRSLGNTQGIYLDLTNAAVTSSSFWNNTDPTSTQFTVGDDGGVNGSGQTFVAYLFAHNAGGFGLTGTDNVISCGSFTGNGSATGPTITLGYEPQWMLIKASSTTSNWYVIDNMRGMTVGGDENRLFANDTSAEAASTMLSPTATGFQLDTAGTPNASGVTYIYIAIRRGPMKTPTSGTSVFLPSVQNTSATSTVTTNFPVDLIIQANNGDSRYFLDRLRGTSTTSSVYVTSNTTNAETSTTVGIGVQSNTSFTDAFNPASSPRYYAYRRAPGFFDEVCYTGTGSARTVTHNLGVAPEMMILKTRTGSSSEWPVYAAPLGATQGLYLGPYADPAITTSGYWNNTSPTSSVFTVGNASASNFNGGNFVAYLFASCPGVSKVGSYTGNGSSQTINCGFTGGARFVMIKRTDSTGDWYVWDTARGIVSANDPRLSLNSTAAEVTTDDSIDPDNSGFIVNQVTATNINVSSATYIYLAIA